MLGLHLRQAWPSLLLSQGELSPGLAGQADIAEKLALGVILGNYKATRHKAEPQRSPLTAVSILAPGLDDAPVTKAAQVRFPHYMGGMLHSSIVLGKTSRSGGAPVPVTSGLFNSSEPMEEPGGILAKQLQLASGTRSPSHGSQPLQARYQSQLGTRREESSSTVWVQMTRWRLAQVAKGVLLARGLVEAPANLCTPQHMADAARSVAESAPDCMQLKVRPAATCNPVVADPVLGPGFSPCRLV